MSALPAKDLLDHHAKLAAVPGDCGSGFMDDHGGHPRYRRFRPIEEEASERATWAWLTLPRTLDFFCCRATRSFTSNFAFFFYHGWLLFFSSL